jgi:hypothetical protein
VKHPTSHPLLLLQRQLIQLPVPPIVAAKWKHRSKTSTEKPVVKERFRKKVVADERGWLLSRQRPVQEPVKRDKEAVASEKAAQKQETSAEETITTQYQKLGTKLTGQTIDLSPV